jgi:hypothetical protein
MHTAQLTCHALREALLNHSGRSPYANVLSRFAREQGAEHIKYKSV